MNEIKYYIKDLVTGNILPTHRKNDLIILEKQNMQLEKSRRGHLIVKRPATQDEINDFLGTKPNKAVKQVKSNKVSK